MSNDKNSKIQYTNGIPNAQTGGVLCVAMNIKDCKDVKKINATGTAQMVNGWTNGALIKGVMASPIKGKSGEIINLLAPAGVGFSRIIIFLVADELKDNDAVDLGGKIANHLFKIHENQIHIWADSQTLSPVAVSNMLLGLELRNYRFDTYNQKILEDAAQYESINLYYDNIAEVKNHETERDAIKHGVYFTRNLVSEPANILNPKEFALRCLRLEKLGVKVEILGEKQMKDLGMNALLGVGQGSANESQMVVMSWNGARQPNQPPIALVGKGVCFDSGGISLKPGPGMEEMIWDMAGAGAVAGTMEVLARRNAPINVVGLLGLVENMPDGKAQRPGDIVTSMSGKTIDIHNTDAEGRLVLADVLWYAQEKHNPSAIVDLATLTGAMIVALGNEHAGCFSNDDKLAGDLLSAGMLVGEKLWRMPLNDNYDKMMDSPRADMKNISGKPAAGSITAAQFLQRFIKKEQKWAHLDIAGMVWSGDDRTLSHRGATGYGVRLLNEFVRSRQP